MGKKWIIVAIIIIGILLGIILGIYSYQSDKGGVIDTNIIGTEKLAVINEEKENEIIENKIIETSSVNMNISPNAIIIEKRYYKTCDHLIREVIDIPEELVNKTEEDVQKKYSDWKLEGYSPTEIVVYKEFKGICNEHYVVKEHNGVIGIYIENNDGQQELLEDTEISVQYLPEEDLENLKVGVKVVGKTNLNSFLEDYE